MFYCLNRKETDPYFNLAAEEYALKELDMEMFMVWRNDPAIIIGKHQNAAREINHDFVQQNNIPVIRRITGGGTVYHDPGNVNFSFITRGEEGKQIDFRRYTRPVIDFLETIGIRAEFTGKNNLFARGKKISGNAAHVYRDRALHHGTLLFSANLNALEDAIRSNEASYTGKSVKSIRNEVTNISEMLDSPTGVESFKDSFFDFMQKRLNDSVVYNWSSADLSRIAEIQALRYKIWEWNFGYSPRFKVENSFLHDNRQYRISVKVSGGLIQSFHIENGDGSGEIPELQPLADDLNGRKHDRKAVNTTFRKWNRDHKVDMELLNRIIKEMF
jgi:lipoate-protein ligase A